MSTAPDRDGAFRHEALLYAGEDEFVRQTTGFIRDAQASGEPVLVVVSRRKIHLLRDALDSSTAGVRFDDIDEIGRNPARIIPAWFDFVAGQEPTTHCFRGIGEPITAGTAPEKLVECQRHESLLNLAFAGAREWWLLCPYDTSTLPGAVIDEAWASHRWVWSDGRRDTSTSYRRLADVAAPFDLPLSKPPVDAFTMLFGFDQLDDVRHRVARIASDAGMDTGRVIDLVLAANEVTTNTVRHGAGGGVIRVWVTSDAVTCEVSDAGSFNQPLAGRIRPTPGQDGGFGLWLVHQVCDLVQIRTFADGSVVRLHMSRR